jgi:spoIIIJ-associated protein
MCDAPGAGLGDAARGTVQDILAHTGLEATASVLGEAPDEVVIDLSGPDVGILIGRHGETLHALQLLASAIFHRRTGTTARLVIDAEGYRERRADALRQRAREVADRVRSTGREAVMQSLRADERRIVHMELAEDPDVYTYSEGEGDDRALIVSPRG